MLSYLSISLIFVLVVSFFGSMQSSPASTLAWRVLPAALNRIESALGTSLTAGWAPTSEVARYGGRARQSRCHPGGF
jgi:hypothetical protein